MLHYLHAARETKNAGVARVDFCFWRETGAAHAVVPDADGRDSSVGAPSSPDLATSPGPYSDDFMEDELADLEGAVLSERPEDVREYASRVLYYLRDLEVKEMSAANCSNVRTHLSRGQRSDSTGHPRQTRRRPRLNYMMRQREINVGMRAMLIDWLVDVRQEFELSHETLYITVSLIDRFLSLMHVTRARLQLVGVACLLVAAYVGSKLVFVLAAERSRSHVSARCAFRTPPANSRRSRRRWWKA